jgi:hypothetical protein
MYKERLTTGWTAEGVGVRVPVGSGIFSTSSTLALGPAQPPIQWVPGALSPSVKRPGRETHLQLVPRSENVDLHVHSPIRLHVVVLN